ncbi:MAG: peptidoglycan DD-metalloendopeptidase family protein [Microcoleaceae cyanobacterium MO_207.B10]|nr:peptidoglycan DD-metalloendopeptidase family protein [Microcoleaceae cyanobacterium MO_207.B10]
MKRAFPNRNKSIATSEFDTGAKQKQSKQMTKGSTSKACSSAAMIGIAAISTTMGASSILLSGSCDQAVAADLPQIDTNKDYSSGVATSSENIAQVNRSQGSLLQKLTQRYIEGQESNDSRIGLTQAETVLPSGHNLVEEKSFAPIEIKNNQGQLKTTESNKNYQSLVVSEPQLNQLTKTDQLPPLGRLGQPQIKKALGFATEGDSRLTKEDLKAGINLAEKQKNRPTKSSVEWKSEEFETVSESVGKSSLNKFPKNSYQKQNNNVVKEPQIQISPKVANNLTSGQFKSNKSEIGKWPTKAQETKVEGAVVIDSEMTSTPVSVVYKVRLGDTLGLIASQHGVSTEALAAINQIKDPNVIEVAQLLKIPKQSFSESLILRKPTNGEYSNLESNKSWTQESSLRQAGKALIKTTTYEAKLPEANLSTIEPHYLSNNTIPSVTVPTVTKTDSLRLVSWSQGVTNKNHQKNQKPKEFPVSTLLSVASEQPKTPLENGKVWPNSLESNIYETDSAIEEEDQIQLGNNGQPIQPPVVEQNFHNTQNPSAARKDNQANPYANRLRGEIMRLRQEYDAQKDSEQSQAPENSQSIPIAVPQPVFSENTLSTNPQVPQKTESRYLQPTYQGEISTPQIRQLSENMRAKRQERGNTTTVVEVQPLESQNNESQKLPVMAAAPIGVNADDILNNPSLGKMVSPDLPPLDRADTYLPGGSMQFTGYVWPSRGELTSGYGWRWGRMHRGIDIAAPTGTPIVAAAPGVVTYADWNSGGYGYLVEIEHPNGSLTLYAHNSQILVRKGQKVAQGELIAKMGSTGRSTGPHLHFEIHPKGNGAVNPMAYLPSGLAYN